MILILACSSALVVGTADTADTDTAAGDTAGDTADTADTAAGDTADTAAGDTADTADTAAGCNGLVAVDPLEVRWEWPAAASDVRTLALEGCVDPLAVACPTWLVVTAPAAVDGRGTVYLAPDPTSYPAASSCYVGAFLVDVILEDLP